MQPDFFSTDTLSAITQFLENFWNLATEVMAIHPIYFLVALVFLPIIGVPVSAITLLGGALYGVETALVLSLIGLTINMVGTYYLAERYFRDWINRFLEKRGHKVWTAQKEAGWELTLLLRCTPAIPIVIQNYILGICKVPMRIYLPISIPMEMLYASVFIFSGGSIYEGHWRWVVFGLSLFALVIILTHLIRHVHKVRSKSSN